MTGHRFRTPGSPIPVDPPVKIRIRIPKTRRDFLALAAGAVGAGTVLPIGTANAAEQARPDSVLIRVCHQFAEADYEAWYRYCTAPDGQEDDNDPPPDFATLNWITATPATTPEGWQAKALACATWNRDMYDGQWHPDTGTPLLAALLRDMVAPIRNAILGRLQEKYGPLPDGYTPDWRWVGRPVA
jgi:hypothetical protein